MKKFVIALTLLLPALLCGCARSVRPEDGLALFETTYDQAQTDLDALHENAALSADGTRWSAAQLEAVRPLGAQTIAVYTIQGRLCAASGTAPDALRDTPVYKRLMGHMTRFTMLGAADGAPVLECVEKLSTPQCKFTCILYLVYPLEALEAFAEDSGATVLILGNGRAYYDCSTHSLVTPPAGSALRGVLDALYSTSYPPGTRRLAFSIDGKKRSGLLCTNDKNFGIFTAP